MRILALTTSTPRGGVALLDAEGAVTTAAYVDLQGHAERLFAAIDEVLAKAGVARASVEGLACDVGPGSFTGVRVGVASAKGIALGLGVPLVGVVSLEAMAAAAFRDGAAAKGDLVLAAIDAKKQELFVAAYDEAGAVVLPPCTRPQGPGALLGVVAPAGGTLVVVGEAAEGVALPEGARLVRGPSFDLPDAAHVGRVARARFAAASDADLVEPLYVRPPDATPAASKSSGSG